MKKNTSDPLPPLEKGSFADSLEENSLLQWITRNGRLLLYIIVALLVVFFIVYQLTSSSRSKTANDFFSAESDFKLFQQPVSSKTDLTAQNEAFEHLNKILQRLPDLHPKYDGLMAQVFIDRNDVFQANKFAHQALERTFNENHPFYTDFAETTLIITKGQDKEALQRSIDLKQKMLESAAQPPEKREFGDDLFALNLLRIAMLQQQTKQTTDELKTWREWLQYAGLGNDKTKIATGIDSKPFQNLLSFYEEGKVSLLNYIEHREKMLNQ